MDDTYVVDYDTPSAETLDVSVATFNFGLEAVNISSSRSMFPWLWLVLSKQKRYQGVAYVKDIVGDDGPLGLVVTEVI